MLNWIELLIVLLGLGVTPILFYRFPRISEESITREKVHRPRLSVIIPARNEESIPYDLFVGDQDISFRMYAEGAQNLVHGWTKNMASGAMKVPLLLFLLVFLFISSMISVPLHVLSFAAAGKITWMFLYLGFYLVWTVVLHILSKKVGAFRFQAVVLFPILLLVMLYIFSVSIVKKVFGLKVTWKGRSI